MNQTTTASLRTLFATHDTLEQILSANGSQFVSRDFAEVLKMNGIQYIKAFTYHPAINREAETFVHTFKEAMKTSSW